MPPENDTSLLPEGLFDKKLRRQIELTLGTAQTIGTRYGQAKAAETRRKELTVTTLNRQYTPNTSEPKPWSPSSWATVARQTWVLKHLPSLAVFDVEVYHGPADMASTKGKEKVNGYEAGPSSHAEKIEEWQRIMSKKFREEAIAELLGAGGFGEHARAIAVNMRAGHLVDQLIIPLHRDGAATAEKFRAGLASQYILSELKYAPKRLQRKDHPVMCVVRKTPRLFPEHCPSKREYERALAAVFMAQLLHADQHGLEAPLQNNDAASVVGPVRSRKAISFSENAIFMDLPLDESSNLRYFDASPQPSNGGDQPTAKSVFVLRLKARPSFDIEHKMLHLEFDMVASTAPGAPLKDVVKNLFHAHLQSGSAAKMIPHLNKLLRDREVEINADENTDTRDKRTLTIHEVVEEPGRVEREAIKAELKEAFDLSFNPKDDCLPWVRVGPVSAVKEARREFQEQQQQQQHQQHQQQQPQQNGEGPDKESSKLEVRPLTAYKLSGVVHAMDSELLHVSLKNEVVRYLDGDDDDDSESIKAQGRFIFQQANQSRLFGEQHVPPSNLERVDTFRAIEAIAKHSK